MKVFYSGDKIKIIAGKPLSSLIWGKEGRIIRWLHDDIYLVEINEKEVVLHETEIDACKE